MALSNPRFQGNRHLEDAESGRNHIRDGHRSDGLHFIQIALLDSGRQIPRSTGGSERGPDDFFGNEADGIIREFQRRDGLSPDRIIGPDTMRALDRQLPRPHSSREPPCPGDEPDERGLQPAPAGGAADLQPLRHSRAVRLRRVAGTDPSTVAKVRAHRHPVQQGHGHRRICRAAGSRLACSAGGGISVNFISRMAGVVGCGEHIPGQPSYPIGSRAASIDAAHEMGHVLPTSQFSPVHHPHRRNIMHASTSPSVQSWPMTERQVRQMRTHPFCHSG